MSKADGSNFEDAPPDAVGGCVECDCKERIEDLEAEIEELEAADVDRQLAAATYGDQPLPEGHRRASDKELQDLGLVYGDQSMLELEDQNFHADVFVKENPGGEDTYTVGFRGTEEWGGSDGITNLRQGLGMDSEYYSQAMEIARTIETMAPGRVSYTGHSMGGGLASAAAGMKGATARTFNAAGLHEKTIAKTAEGDFSNTRAYYLHQDPLSRANAEFDRLPEAVGNRVGYERVHEWAPAESAILDAQRAKEYNWLERKVGRPTLDRKIAETEAEFHRQKRYHGTDELGEAIQNDLKSKREELEGLREGPCKNT